MARQAEVRGKFIHSKEINAADSGTRRSQVEVVYNKPLSLLLVAMNYHLISSQYPVISINFSSS